MKRCLGCFEEIKKDLQVCPFCGYVDGACSDVENSIAIGSILSGRYQIGKVIESDNSSITYLAWDKNSDMKFSIKEFFPKDLVNRKSNSSEIAVKGDKKQLFDNGFNEFVAEAKRMYAGNGSVKLYDCIAVNNTAYMILEAPNQTDGFNPFKSVKNDVIDSNPSIDSSNGINIIKTGDKERDLKQLINSIPLWAKIAAPVLIGVVILIAILSKVGFSTSKNDVDEIESEAAITENTVEPTNTVVDAEVLVLDGKSYACYSGYETWEDARDYCESLGGHLAVISSQRENDALYSFSLVCGYDNVYIGYSDAEHEGDWQWVNGENSDYTNWNSGEPNGFTQLENYAVMSTDGKWFDADYAPRYEGGMVSFICEWDYEVSGTSIVRYSDLERLVESLLITPSPTETTIEQMVEETSFTEETDNNTEIQTLTESQAISAFRNYLAERIAPTPLYDCALFYLYYEGFSNGNYVFSYGPPSGYYTYFEMDPNTGNTTSVSYDTSALANVHSVGEYDFNAYDYMSSGQSSIGVDLHSYMDTDIYSFAAEIGNLTRGNETSAIGYHNNYMNVETYDSVDTTAIGYISLTEPQEQYSICGVRPGMSRESAMTALITNDTYCYTSPDSGSTYAFSLNDGYDVLFTVDQSTDTVVQVWIRRYLEY